MLALARLAYMTSSGSQERGDGRARRSTAGQRTSRRFADEQAEERGHHLFNLSAALFAHPQAQSRAVTEGRSDARPIYDSSRDEPIILHESEAPLFGVLLSQFSLKQGLRRYGERAEKGTA